jgi:hypothetical protein
MQELKVFRVMLVFKDLKAIQVIQELLDQLEKQVQQELRGLAELKDQRVIPVILVL